MLEVACGGGIGLGYLARTAKKVVGGDRKADAIVVLDGDPLDERLLHSVQLWRSGYAPIVTSNYHTWRTKSVYEKEWRGGGDTGQTAGHFFMSSVR